MNGNSPQAVNGAQPIPLHDKAMAEAFLASREPNAQNHNFQFLNDKVGRGFSQVLSLTFERAWALIKEANTPTHYLGVFVITTNASGQRVRVRLPGTLNLKNPDAPRLVNGADNPPAGTRSTPNDGLATPVEKPSSMMAAALALSAERGWHIFPARIKGKQKFSWTSKDDPKGSGLNWGMTADPALIQSYYKRFPQAGVGVPTGKTNRIWVFETDTKAGHANLEADGEASLRALEAEHGPLPDTLMAESPSKSRHRYFNWPEGIEIKNSSSSIASGIDVRGEGGMVIAPPSVRGDGEYRWLNNNDIADAPQWLIEAVAAASNSKGKAGKGKKPSLDGQKPVVIAEPFKGFEYQALGQGIELRRAPPQPFEPIKQGCAWLREVHDTGGADQGEDLWRDALRVCMFLENGETLIHEFSDKYEGYSAEETKKKYDEAYRYKEDRDLGWPLCKTIQEHGCTHCESCPHLALGKSPLHLALQPIPSADAGVTLADFRAYLPDHSYIFTPTGTFWSAAGVNACFRTKANVWLDKNQPVHHLTWAPGHPQRIENQLVVDGGWIERKGVTTFNLYRPPTLKHGDPSKAGPWLELVHKVYPEDAGRLITKLAHREQRPQEKINHAVVLGGAPGIGKDTILEPVKRAIGAWNFKETSPQQILGRFNGYLQSVIMRISEVRDLGDFNRYQFYEHTKVYFAAPPDVLRVDEKNIPEHDVMNCTFAILTTNRLTDGIYLPPDDRRHDVMWSKLTSVNFTDDYWRGMWGWYDAGGDSHVAAYLATLDISTFDPKAPPPKTPAFWAIVDANRAPEEGELQDLLDKLGTPDAVTVQQIIETAGGVVRGPYGDKENIANWLADRKNRRIIPHRFDAVGYTPVRNNDRGTGVWVVGGVRQVVYAKNNLPLRDQIEAVRTLQREADRKKPKKAGGLFGGIFAGLANDES